MITIDTDTISDFSKKIRYRGVGVYLDSYYEFYRDNYPNIVNFFSATVNKISITNFTKLLAIINESKVINDKIIAAKSKLTNYKDWEVVEYFDDLAQALILITQTSKFLRSSVTNFNFDNTIEFDYVAKQKQTIENVSNRVLKSSNFDNEWVDIALRNNLSELDYTVNGGEVLILSINKGSTNIFIKSVVDNIIGEKVYGLDIDRRMNFSNDDITVLSYKDTVRQSVDILSSIKKGDVPEFLTLGISNFVGGNVAILGFSSISRQLNEVFSSDDTLSGFKIVEAKIVDGDFSINFEVSTYLDLIVQNNVKL